MSFAFSNDRISRPQEVQVRYVFKGLSPKEEDDIQKIIHLTVSDSADEYPSQAQVEEKVDTYLKQVLEEKVTGLSQQQYAAEQSIVYPQEMDGYTLQELEEKMDGISHIGNLQEMHEQKFVHPQAIIDEQTDGISPAIIDEQFQAEEVPESMQTADFSAQDLIQRLLDGQTSESPRGPIRLSSNHPPVFRGRRI